MRAPKTDTELLADIGRCSASLYVDEQGHLKLRGAAGVPESVRQQLAARRKEIAAILVQNASGSKFCGLSEEAGVSGHPVARMTLAEFAASGQVVRMESAEFGQIALVADGAEEPEGFVAYSVAEARRVLEMEPEMLHLVHKVKAMFGGKIQTEGLSAQ